MQRRSFLARLGRLSAADLRLLGEATVCLALARVKTAFLPFKRLVGPLATATGLERVEPVAARRLAWSVRAASRRMPFRAVCLEQALALTAMMRRRGLASRFHYGITDQGERRLHAHVWVSSGSTPLIGNDEAADFTQVFSVP